MATQKKSGTKKARDKKRTPKKKLVFPVEIKLEDQIVLGSEGKVKRDKLTFVKRIEIGMMQDYVVGANMELTVGQTIPLLAGMMGEDEEIIKKLSRRDYGKCVEVLYHFL